MKMYIGDNYQTKEENFIESKNICFITAPTGHGKTILTLNIIEKLKKEYVDITACIEYFNDSNITESICKDAVGILKVTDNLEHAVSDLYYTLNDRRSTATKDFPLSVHIFDINYKESSGLNEFLEISDKELKELNISIIIVSQVSRTPITDAPSITAECDYDYSFIKIKRNGDLDEIEYSNLGFEVHTKLAKETLPLIYRVHLKNLKLRGLEV